MRPLDRGVEIDLTLRNMAGGAEIVVELRAAGMLIASREVDVVMAGAARCPGRASQMGGGLRGLGRLAMANLATPHIRRINHCRPVTDGVIESDDLIRLARLDAWQA